ncbi:hypothetical protein FH593_00610 [Leptospira interrogans]|uniref:hypothetical protein n=1 Tax=Leptospira interrogans TaxID=173 RepID=UPI0002923352|nr:hypothetical protein [Leptospira interrogans]EKO04972.1 hypothetical protein LEP1GSC077_0440 [Leptospira interrogans str. C10069]EMN64608.1 hypothetical protein LEP1GSC092_0575 [Leptospira interrogans serovar Pyrogenes str. R168]ULG84542.1 hypothetical protein FH594_01460 [Leptospira interrogans]ULG88600.1 hypothetical protein FH593_00610 [Leptospira interrogans]
MRSKQIFSSSKPPTGIKVIFRKAHAVGQAIALGAQRLTATDFCKFGLRNAEFTFFKVGVPTFL